MNLWLSMAMLDPRLIAVSVIIVSYLTGVVSVLVAFYLLREPYNKSIIDRHNHGLISRAEAESLRTQRELEKIREENEYIKSRLRIVRSALESQSKEGES